MQACPFSVYLSGNCTLIDTYMHLLFSCCLLDPDHVTSALTCSGFTCPTSAAEPESLCLGSFSGCTRSPILLPTAGWMCQEDVHISDSCPQKIASGKQDIAPHLYCPSGSRTPKGCALSSCHSSPAGTAWLTVGVPDLITRPFLAVSLSQFPTLLLSFPGNTY